MNEPKRRVLTQEEILVGLSDLAENGEGAQRSQAYRMLMAAGGASSVVLPQPITAQDCVPLLARLMRAAGPEASQLGFRRAFPRKSIYEVPDIDVADFPKPKDIQLARTLKALYKACPELKRSGYPKGYPTRYGEAAKVQWCMKQHLLTLRTREQEAIAKAREEELAKGMDADDTQAKTAQ